MKLIDYCFDRFSAPMTKINENMPEETHFRVAEMGEDRLNPFIRDKCTCE